MLPASFEPMVAKCVLNSFDSIVGFVIDTSFTFRDVTESFPDFLEVSSLIYSLPSLSGIDFVFVKTIMIVGLFC